MGRPASMAMTRRNVWFPPPHRYQTNAIVCRRGVPSISVSAQRGARRTAGLLRRALDDLPFDPSWRD